MIQFYSKDGKELKKDEFVKLVTAVKDGSFEEKMKAEDATRRALFDKMDTDNSESISKSELKEALSQVESAQSADFVRSQPSETRAAALTRMCTVLGFVNCSVESKSLGVHVNPCRRKLGRGCWRMLTKTLETARNSASRRFLSLLTT